MVLIKVRAGLKDKHKTVSSLRYTPGHLAILPDAVAFASRGDEANGFPLLCAHFDQTKTTERTARQQDSQGSSTDDRSTLSADNLSTLGGDERSPPPDLSQSARKSRGSWDVKRDLALLLLRGSALSFSVFSSFFFAHMITNVTCRLLPIHTHTHTAVSIVSISSPTVVVSCSGMSQLWGFV